MLQKNCLESTCFINSWVESFSTYYLPLVLPHICLYLYPIFVFYTLTAKTPNALMFVLLKPIFVSHKYIELKQSNCIYFYTIFLNLHVLGLYKLLFKRRFIQFIIKSHLENFRFYRVILTNLVYLLNFTEWTFFASVKYKYLTFRLR